MKAYCKRLAAGFLFVLLGSYAALFSLLDPFSLTAHRPTLLAVCLLAALASAAVHAMPEGRRHTWVVLTLLALLALFAWLERDRLLAGAQVVFHEISLTYHRQITYLLFYELPEALSEAPGPYRLETATEFLSLSVALLSLWTGGWFLRGWPAGYAAVPVCLFPGLSLFVLLLPDPLSLAAWLLFLALTVLSRKGYLESADLGARRLLLSALPATLVMGLLCLVFPPESYLRSPQVEDLRQRVERMDTPLTNKNNPSPPGVQRFDRWLPPRFNGRTVLLLEPGDAQGTLLLRGFSAGVYTSAGWDPLPAEVYDSLPTQGTADPYAYPAQAADPTFSLTGQRLFLTDVATNSGYFYLPYFPETLPETAPLVGDAYLALPEGVHPSYASALRYSSTYLPSDQVPVGAATTLRSEPDYREWVYGAYLDVPYDQLSGEALEVIRSSAGPFLEATASWSDLRGYRMAQARAVADYLASFTVYDQSAPAAPLGADPVSYFLTTSHRGYCVHYASAATLILRELGVPARFTAGYLVRLDGSGGQVSVPDRNAHAWVEIYIDGFGWQPVDVTPGFSGDPPQSALPNPSPSPLAVPSPSPSPSIKPTPAPTPQAPTPSPAASGGSETPGDPVANALPAWLLWLLALVLAAAAVILQRRLRPALRRRRWARLAPNAAAIDLYRYLVCAARHGGPAVPEEAFFLAQKAAFSQHTLTSQELQTMTALARKTALACRSAPLPRRLLLRYLWALC